tara:strand:+ start:129751 stop:131199 length:1449 start_codon:yes stop_codon:yes gene_type:complete
MTVALIFVAFMLLLGLILRQRVGIFRWLYIPSSVIAGAIGLVVIQAVLMGPNDASAISWARDLAQTLSSWPGFLIAIVFAGMLLERKPAPIRQRVQGVARQGLMVWIIVLGQTAVGLTATWLLVQPFYDVPNAFGMLIETGFAGGHGTAAAMGEVFKHPTIELAGGLELGTLMATVGLVYGVVTGILWINVAIRFGWVDPHMTKASLKSQAATDERHQPEPIGYSAISREAIDPLLVQMVWLTVAFGIGMLMQACVVSAAVWWDAGTTPQLAKDAASGQLAQRLTASSVLDFPLFIYTLFGGLAVRRVMEGLGLGHLIDSSTINRLTSAAMDILVVAAIASLNLVATQALLVPFTVLLISGAIWVGVCLLVISRRVLPAEHWFQLGLINYGMSTGTTATGFVLLRVIDPELESGAAEDYALAAPLSAPFIGGGILTVALPLIVLQQIPIAISALGMIAMVFVLTVIGIRWRATPAQPDSSSL